MDVPSPPSLEIESLIRRGHESPDVDYKGPGNWRTWKRAEKVELARDMMAMGNSDRPGWIILGISEGPGGQWVYEGLSESAASSFDPTRVGTLIKRYCDPEASFTVHRTTVDGRLYVAISVAPFQTRPHVCKQSCGEVVEESAVYVRTEACQTSKITTAEQMRRLIDRATQVHADSIVQRIEEFYVRVHGPLAPMPPPAPDTRSLFEEEIEQARKRAGGG